MSRAAATLRRAIETRLRADRPLCLALGGEGRILDRPHGTALPVLLHGGWEALDYSTATEPGEEHLLVLEIWTGADAQATGLDIAARVVTLLDGAALPLTGARLVSLAHTATRTRREPRSRACVTAVSLRAVTEG